MTATLIRRSRPWIASLILAVTAAMALPAAAAGKMPDEAEAKTYIGHVADDFFGVLRNHHIDEATRRAELKKLMISQVAVNYIGKLALGRRIRPAPGLSPDQRTAYEAQLAEYKDIFPDFLFEKMYDLVLKKFKDSAVEVVGATPIRNTDMFVHTIIHRPAAEPVNADWRVRRDNDGNLKIIDVKAEGVSMTLTQRDDFASIIGGSGDLGKILDHMRATIAADREGSAPSSAGTAPAADKTAKPGAT